MASAHELAGTPLLRPLLNRRRLLPGESLPSLLARLKNANYYDTPKTFQTICKPHLASPDNLNQPLQADTFRVLAAMTRLSCFELYLASDHSFAPVFTWQEGQTKSLPSGEAVPWLSAGMRQRYILSVEDAQYCPQCLAENPYHRVSWLNQLTVICPFHHCLLQRKCPNCSHSLSVQSVVDKRCHHGHALLQAAQVSLQADEWGLFTHLLIQSWWSDVKPPSFPVNTVLLDKPVPFLLELLRGLSYAVAHNPQMALFHQPSFPFPEILDQANPTFFPAQLYVLYNTALKGIVNWPEGFYAFLDAIRAARRGQSAFTRQLGRIYTSWLERGWSDPIFQGVQEAFNHYLRHCFPMSSDLLRLPRVRENPAFADLWPFVTDLKAAQMLHLTPEMIRELVKMGYITAYHQVYPNAPPTHANLVKQADVEALSQQWGRTITLKSAAGRLQTTPDMILALCHQRVLEAICLPVGDEPDRWRVKMGSLEEMYLQLRRLTQQKPGEPLIALKEAAQWWGPSALDMAQVIQGVVKRRVRAYSKRRLLDEMQVVKQDVERLFAGEEVPEFPIETFPETSEFWYIL